jgi:hypothetical protein
VLSRIPHQSRHDEKARGMNHPPDPGSEALLECEMYRFRLLQ